MIALIIIVYSVIAVCVSFVVTLYEYYNERDCYDDIEDYLYINDDYILPFILSGIIWPMTLMIILFMEVLQFIYKKILIVIYRLIIGKEDKY